MARPEWQPSPEQQERILQMARYGHTQETIAAAMGVAPRTLVKHCRELLKEARRDLHVELHNWMVGSILGRPETETFHPVTDDRARVALALGFARSQMGWSDASVNHKHSGTVDVEHSAKLDIEAENAARQEFFALLDKIAARRADRADSADDAGATGEVLEAPIPEREA